MTSAPQPRGRAFAQVDVFTDRPFFGNPVAVVLDADGLDDVAMQQIAQWTNLSETTFVLPATMDGADYRLRIFTPRSELPFAGHPTLGSAHALQDSGRFDRAGATLVQQCGAGLVPITVPADWRTAGVSFVLPEAQITAAPDPSALAGVLRVQPAAAPAIVNVGPRWVVVELADTASVRNAAPDFVGLASYDRAHGTTGVTIFAADGDDVVVRSFAPADGIDEDPVCGSGNGAVAAYRRSVGQCGAGTSYVASQGREVGRDGAVAVRFAGDAIMVGGRCVTVITGVINA